MRPVDRYRAWALRGSFILDGGEDRIKIRWPGPENLFDHHPDAPLRDRLENLAGQRFDRLAAALTAEDPLVAAMVADDMADYFGCSQAHRLRALIDRYGPAVAADLAETYGIDLLDLFRGRLLPDEVMEKVDGFPRHSRLSEALAQDDDLAALGTDDEEAVSSTSPTVRHTEWTPEVERLAVIEDRLGALIGVVASALGSNITLPPAPRPAGAASRLRAARENDAYDDLMADVAAAQARSEEAQLRPEEG